MKAESCFCLCACVCVHQRVSAVYFSAPVAFFSTHNEESGNGTFCAADTLAILDLSLITANNRQFELWGLYFCVSGHWTDWFICCDLQRFSIWAFCVFRKVKAKTSFKPFLTSFTFAVISNKCTCKLDLLLKKALHSFGRTFLWLASHCNMLVKAWRCHATTFGL